MRRNDVKGGTVVRIMLTVTTVLLLLSVIYGAFILFYRQTYPREYTDLIARYSEEYDVPEAIILSVIYVESSFNPEAVSRSGAQGLMQLMPSTYEDICGRIGLIPDMELIRDPSINIRCGTFYLSYLYGIFGRWDTVFAAYNAGLGNVGRWLADERYSDDGISLTDIPVSETRRYVRKIRSALDVYENIAHNND